MVQGIGFSEREKKFISDHKDDMFPQQIANTLGEIYSEDNGGIRCREAVVKFIKRDNID